MANGLLTKQEYTADIKVVFKDTTKEIGTV
jgi:hypothetical protein